MNPAFQRTFANPRAMTPVRGLARDETLRAEMDENAPPTPSVEDDIPAASKYVFISSNLKLIRVDTRMIGALAVSSWPPEPIPSTDKIQNSRASTPLTISALQTPTRQNLQLRSGASTLAGSVVDAPTSSEPTAFGANSC